MMPASNMKIVTLAVAAERLGWDFSYDTSLVATGPIENGVLEGDLVVVGSGDPTIVRREGAVSVFERWADELAAAGIHAIGGRLIGDDNAFDDEPLGAGWAWDYLAFGYAAPTGALQFNEDAAQLVVTPAARAGDPAAVRLDSPESGLTIDNHAVTAPDGVAGEIDLRRLPGSGRLRVSGTIPLGSAPIVRAVSVDNPTDYFAGALAATLAARGIVVRGGAIDIDALPGPPDLGAARPLATFRSAPLAEMAGVMMKVSQNLYAETLLKTVAARVGEPTVEGGRKVVREVLAGWGIAPESVVPADGSGLSRYNYVTAAALVTILERMHCDPRHQAAFEATLPIAGKDGTLERRMRGSAAEGNARAKTGTIANVRTLSGYVRTRDGELLAFSILANHFTAPAAVIDAVTDLVVERLAAFSRR